MFVSKSEYNRLVERVKEADREKARASRRYQNSLDMMTISAKIKDQTIRGYEHRIGQLKAQLEVVKNRAEDRVAAFCAERDAVMESNAELYNEGVKAQTEILELKADIADQVRINRAYATEIGGLRHANDKLRTQVRAHLNAAYGKPMEHKHFVFDTDSVDTTKPEPEPKPEPGYGPEYLKLQRQVKRLKAKVAKLTKHNKALSAEVLQSRNGMM